MFIERVTLNIAKPITVFLTDKLYEDVKEAVTTIIDEFTNKLEALSNEVNISSNSLDSEGFYTSSLNSVSISEIQAKVTMKKVLFEGSESQRKIKDMQSIVELEGSGIKLPKVDINEPVNSTHLTTITKMYVMEIIMGCLGGMNLIGNPKQFMEEIEAGRMRGKPVLGLVGGVLAGTANSMSKILSTVSNGVSILSMDYEYQRHRN
jgi:hypothetical protein